MSICLLLLMMAVAIVFPGNAQVQTEYALAGSRKAVATTTDVAAVALPVATFAGVLISHDWKGVKQGVAVAAATAASTLILKYSIREMRPDFSNTHSFPSGHSAVSFATASFLQKRYGWRFGVPAFALSGYVAWGRVFAKKHHWWDVVAGALIGASFGYVFTTPWALQHDLQLSARLSNSDFGFTASLSL